MPVEWTDLMLAATASAHGLVVVTRNVRHFDRIPDSNVENWFPPEPGGNS
jgi:tRNA(fMet)-specific endonuclease VapC